MERLKISAVIPAYNAERYVAAAVDSVLAQTYPAFEVIVVDDGSIDGTAAVLTRYGNTIRYIRQENRGEPAARNSGIRNATGDFIAFLDADDLWTPDKLQLQAEYLQAHKNCALVYSDMATFSETGTVLRSFRERFKFPFVAGKIFTQLFSRNMFGSGSVVFRKSCVDVVGWFDESLLIGSDYEMWLRITRHFEAGYVDKALLLYRQHPGMSTRGLGQVLQGQDPWQVIVLKKILRQYPEAEKELGKSLIERRMSRPFAILGFNLFTKKDYAHSRQMLRRALDYWPTNLQYRLVYLLTLLPPPQVEMVRKLYHKVSG